MVEITTNAQKLVEHANILNGPMEVEIILVGIREICQTRQCATNAMNLVISLALAQMETVEEQVPVQAGEALNGVVAEAKMEEVSEVRQRRSQRLANSNL